MVEVNLILGDCLDVLPAIPAQSVDAVITDPPYPCIKRDYGTWTEQEWWDMMMIVCAETRRILKPTGSAVFILQPNSKHVGQMRGWLWEFMAWVCREWNMVQDVWWWNPAVMPNGLTTTGGLLRSSVKACIWAGSSECYRGQDSVLWTEAETSKARYAQARASGEIDAGRMYYPSGNSKDWGTAYGAAERRGGVTPFNLLPFGNSSAHNSAGANGHSAGTPLKLADWWTRYICPPGGTVADWFMGSGTMGIAAVQNGCNFVGIERLDKPGYYPTAVERIGKAEAQAQPALEGF